MSLHPFLQTRQRGFTLVEVVVAMSILTVAATGVFSAFSVINTNAMVSRLYTQAQAVAEEQIDAILTKGPFDPTQTPPKIPAELTIGTTTKTGVLVYTDPVTNQVVVTGEMITTIGDAGITQTISGKTTNLNVRRAKVEVRYAYRSRLRDPGTGATLPNYSVVLNTLRTADQ